MVKYPYSAFALHVKQDAQLFLHEIKKATHWWHAAKILPRYLSFFTGGNSNIIEGRHSVCKAHVRRKIRVNEKFIFA